MNDKDAKSTIENLEAIKKLLVLQTLDAGYSQAQIGAALGISQASVSRLFPDGVPKRK